LSCAERILLAQTFDLGPGQLEHQLKRVGLNSCSGCDARPRYRQSFSGAPNSLISDARQLLIDQHIVIAGFGLQRRAESLFQLPACALATSALVRETSVNFRKLKIS
jgi:hypothetical protein